MVPHESRRSRLSRPLESRMTVNPRVTSELRCARLRLIASVAEAQQRPATLTGCAACHRRLAFPSAAVSWTSVRACGKRKFVGREPMFAVVRTGGKQYRVAPGDKIV